MNNILNKLKKYVNLYYISFKYELSNLSSKEKIIGLINILMLGILIIFLIDIMFLGFSITKHSPVSIGIGSGSSMDPIIDSGCSIIFTDSYNGEENLREGDIVTYSTDTMSAYYTHKIVKKYDSYNPDTAENKILHNKHSEKYNRFTIDKDIENNYINTKQSVERTEELRGETVYIMKGTNNDIVDEYLVTDEDILASVYKPYIELSDDNSVCRENPLNHINKINIQFHF